MLAALLWEGSKPWASEGLEIPPELLLQIFKSSLRLIGSVGSGVELSEQKYLLLYLFLCLPIGTKMNTMWFLI